MSVEPRLQVRFYRTEAGNEPVREWLKMLPPKEKKIIGDDLKTAQYGWPLGMPLIRKLEPGLWEVRSRPQDRIGGSSLPWRGIPWSCCMVSSRNQRRCRSKTCNWPDSGFNHWLRIERGMMNEKHLGSSLDDFLAEEGRLTEAEAIATKRVLAFQIAKLMEEQQLSKTEMARRMSTSRAAVDRLLDSDSESATLATLEKAAAALGRRLQIALV